MIARPAGQWVLFAVWVVGCRGENRAGSDSARSLPPVFPSGPANTNWNPDAGPVMIVTTDNSDTVGVVIPEATDSTIEALQGMTAPISGLKFDLFGRAGKSASALPVTPISQGDTADQCYSWPLAKLASARANWRVGFVSGRVQAIPLDSIEALNSSDSSALAVSLAQTAATLPGASDPTFRGLPFRVRSAYRFSLDSLDVVIADVVRTVNEEANPRVEHLLIVGQKPRSVAGKFAVVYYSRTAGKEEAIQATEVLAVVRVGSSRRPVIVVNIEYDDGGKLGFIERTAPGEWRATWRSAYTDC